MGVVLATAAFTATGCGDDGDSPTTPTTATALPPDAVAVIDGQPLSERAFEDRRLLALATHPHGDALLEAEGDLAECAARIEDAGKPVAGADGQAVRVDELATYCEQQYAQARHQAMRALLSSAIARRIADDRGVDVPEAVLRRIEASLVRGDPDVHRRIESLQLGQKRVRQGLRDAFYERAFQQQLAKDMRRPITDDRIAKYYKGHTEEFALPERRRARVLVAPSEHDARAASRELRRGEAWPEVVERYATQGASRELGGRPVALTADEELSETSDPLFRANPGELVGPIEIETGWLLAEVVDRLPARERTLTEARDDIVDALRREDLNRAEQLYLSAATAWHERIQCRPELVIDLCANGPESSTGAPGPATTP